MTNSTVTIPAAVAHVNALITRAIVLGNVPEIDYGPWSKVAQQMAENAEEAIFVPGWNLTFGTEFGSRVTLDVRPGNKRLGFEGKVEIGTSGNSRSIATTAQMAKTLTGVAALACDIEAFLSSVDPQPLPAAVEAHKQESEGRDDARRESAEKAEAAEKAIRSERAKKGAAQRKLNEASRQGMAFEQVRKLQKMVDDGQFDAVVEACSK